MILFCWIGNLVKQNTQVQHVSVTITPDPEAQQYPRFSKPSLGCPDEAEISFTFKDRDTHLHIKRNKHLDVDNVPVSVGNDAGIHQWHSSSKVRKTQLPMDEEKIQDTEPLWKEADPRFLRHQVNHQTGTRLDFPVL